MVHLSATSNVFTSLWSKQEGIVLLPQKIARFFYIYLSLQNKQYRMCIRCVFSYGKKIYIHNNIYTKNIYNVYTHPHIHAYVYTVYIYIYIYIYIYDTLALIIDEKKFKILFGLFFSFCQSTHWKNHIWFKNLWNISQSSKGHATHRNASD